MTHEEIAIKIYIKNIYNFSEPDQCAKWAIACATIILDELKNHNEEDAIPL